MIFSLKVSAYFTILIFFLINTLNIFEGAMNKKRRLLMSAIPTQTLPVSSVHNTSPKKDLVLRTEKKVTYIQHKKQKWLIYL